MAKKPEARSWSGEVKIEDCNSHALAWGERNEEALEKAQGCSIFNQREYH